MAPPDEWRKLMREPLPAGACVIRVAEDFIEMQKGVSELWIHNLYLLVDSEPFLEGVTGAPHTGHRCLVH